MFTIELFGNFFVGFYFLMSSLVPKRLSFGGHRIPHYANKQFKQDLCATNSYKLKACLLLTCMCVCQYWRMCVAGACKSPTRTLEHFYLTLSLGFRPQKTAQMTDQTADRWTNEQTHSLIELLFATK